MKCDQYSLQTCRYYLKGSCVYGSRCRYSHVKPKTQEDKSQERRYCEATVGGTVDDDGGIV